MGGEVEFAGEEVFVAQVEGGGDKPGDIDAGALADQDAGRVDEEDFAVGGQGAQQLRGVGADDAVEHGAGGGLLDEAGGFVRVDAETLPVDDRIRAVGDGEGVADLVDRSRAVDDLCADGVGLYVGAEAAGYNQGDRFDL